MNKTNVTGDCVNGTETLFKSDNYLTIVDQVIVLGATVGSFKTLSGVSRAYYVNLNSFTPLQL